MARAPKRKPAARSPRKVAPLTTALSAVRAQNFADALVLLLAAWKAEPSDALADAIGLVSSRLKVPALVRGKGKAALTAWTARANTAKPQDVPVLLEVLADASSGEGLARLAQIAKWMPDPRIDAALVDLLDRVPYRATSTQPFWNAVFELAGTITDVRQLRRLDGLTAEGVAVTMQAWLRGKLAALRETTAWKLNVVNPEPPEVTEILALLGPRKLSIGSKNLEALLGAIYDTPDDDAPRLVLADALLERGDPRGEFIALQLRGDRDSERISIKREKELLETYGKQWLGELAPVVMAGYTFARGFLADCRIDNRQLDRVQKLAGDPAWATVRSLAGSALIGLHPVMRGLRRLSFTSYEARNHEGLTESWRDLLLDTERPLEALRYAGIQTDEAWEDALENNESVRPGVQGRWVHVPEVQEVAALCSCRALPRLRELVIVAQPDRIAPSLFASALVQRLDTIGFVFDYRSRRRAPLADLTDALRDAPVRVLMLELGPDYHTTFLVLTRGDSGYREATMTVGPTTRSSWSQQLVDEAIGILDALPKSLRELRITTRRNTDPQQVARLRAAAEQMRLAVCEVDY